MTDRVEVRWGAGLFDAEVIDVHSSGKLDVKYDRDGSESVFLDGEEKVQRMRCELVNGWPEHRELQRLTVSEAWR